MTELLIFGIGLALLYLVSVMFSAAVIFGQRRADRERNGGGFSDDPEFQCLYESWMNDPSAEKSHAVLDYLNEVGVTEVASEDS